MKQRDIQVLQEMGLTYWQVRKPECFPALEVPVINFPDDCKLLFITEETLTEHDAWLFGRILKSMKLTPEQALMLPPSALEQLGQHQLVWCWIAGCTVTAPVGVQALLSAALSTMHTNPAAKKALWQQICSYDN
ncbi:DNA polymerase III subunit psi [Photobacterium sanguinicancri]|uniref:DNA polymerase III subunit psi n=1 Tax=Photobacterium sanguinicancri TaxID=875932 RepID=A0ABX4G406_9GAMM|nr:DNA polymerase III subunit psi [Photobacterium sanguinicancri]OZS45873.1 DNA polymerase III subunit psi [Photobacterium sanguinicancri]